MSEVRDGTAPRYVHAQAFVGALEVADAAELVEASLLRSYVEDRKSVV